MVHLMLLNKTVNEYSSLIVMSFMNTMFDQETIGPNLYLDFFRIYI